MSARDLAVENSDRIPTSEPNEPEKVTSQEMA